MGRAATGGGEQGLNLRLPREFGINPALQRLPVSQTGSCVSTSRQQGCNEKGSFHLSKCSGALDQLALFSDRGAPAVPGRDTQRPARARDPSPFASRKWLLGAGAENRAVGADTGRRSDPGERA